MNGRRKATLSKRMTFAVLIFYNFTIYVLSSSFLESLGLPQDLFRSLFTVALQVACVPPTL